MSQKSRLIKLEGVAQAARVPGWNIPIIDALNYASESDLEDAINKLRSEALKAGWRPEQGVFVMVLRGENEKE